jgi:hypothetical protein
MAAGDGLVSNEYHLILGPNAPYNPELSQNEIVKKYSQCWLNMHSQTRGK